MKNFISALIASFVIVTSTSVAHANNNTQNVVIGILGGALGGLVVGEIIGNNNRPIYQQPVIIQPQPVCYDKWVTIWDPYINQYVQVRRTYC